MSDQQSETHPLRSRSGRRRRASRSVALMVIVGFPVIVGVALLALARRPFSSTISYLLATAGAIAVLVPACMLIRWAANWIRHRLSREFRS